MKSTKKMIAKKQKTKKEGSLAFVVSDEISYSLIDCQANFKTLGIEIGAGKNKQKLYLLYRPPSIWVESTLLDLEKNLFRFNKIDDDFAIVGDVNIDTIKNK